MRSLVLCLTFSIAIGIAACASDPEGSDAGTGDGEPDDQEVVALTPVDTPEPEIEAPALAPISRVEIEAELEPGAGCSVESDGKALLVVVEGDSIARPYGTLRHFEFDGEGDAFWEGGTFTAGAISIAVERGEGEGEQIEGLTVWPATVTVSEEGQSGRAVFDDVEWHCGG